MVGPNFVTKYTQEPSLLSQYYLGSLKYFFHHVSATSLTYLEILLDSSQAMAALLQKLRKFVNLKEVVLRSHRQFLLVDIDRCVSPVLQLASIRKLSILKLYAECDFRIESRVLEELTISGKFMFSQLSIERLQVPNLRTLTIDQYDDSSPFQNLELMRHLWENCPQLKVCNGLVLASLCKPAGDNTQNWFQALEKRDPEDRDLEDREFCDFGDRGWW